MRDVPAFRDDQPLAWLYHRNTCRWIFNTLDSGDEMHAPQAGKEYPSASAVPLPRGLPAADLAGLLERRASCRAFADAPLSLDQFGTVLHAAYGVLGAATFGALELLERPVPSGGALYPLELYAIVRAVDGVDPGVYHYFPVAHELEHLRDGPFPRPFLTYLFMGQEYIADAGAILVTTVVPGRFLAKYGDRGYRYLLFEAGHVAQNIDLAALAVGLGACNLGGFFDDELAGLLTLDVEHELPLYATAIGAPAGPDKAEQRAVVLSSQPQP
jgi:SagB-type dehydrogenase family enzyme